MDGSLQLGFVVGSVTLRTQPGQSLRDMSRDVIIRFALSSCPVLLASIGVMFVMPINRAIEAATIANGTRG